MKKILGLAIFTVIATTGVTPAYAGGEGAVSIPMPAQVRIVRCVTNEERLQMCNKENLCCNLPMTEFADNNTPSQQNAAGADQNAYAPINIAQLGGGRIWELGGIFRKHMPL